MIYELLHNVSHVSWGFFDLMVFWRNRETVKPLSLRRLPLDLKASPKLTDRSWPQSEKNGQNEEINGELEHPTKDDIMINEGFKGKIIKLNSGFSSKPCLPKGQSFFLAVLSQNMGYQEIHSHVPGLENCSGDIDLRFPWMFHFLVRS